MRALWDKSAGFAARHQTLTTIFGLGVIVGLSYVLRTQALWAKFWIDEGLSVGIAHHPLTDIPTVLQKDGAPPLYYLLLHLWMDLIGGDGEARVHAFSVLCALLTIPAGWWAGRRLFGPATGWAAAAMLATLPFLTYYAQEARMYALAVLIGLIASASITAVLALRQRALIPLAVVFGALAPYTHNWGLFMLAGCGIAWLVLVYTSAPEIRKDLVRDGLIVFGLIGLLYLPWIPTLLDQARQTGAPWADKPPLEAIVNIIEITVGGTGTGLAVVLVSGFGLSQLRGAEPERARAALMLVVMGLSAVVMAWIASQASPAWSGRYISVLVGPAVLLAAAGLVRARALGLVTLAVVLVLWWNPQEFSIKSKSDVYRVTRVLKDRQLAQRGDTILAVHPEQGPVVRYYLGDGFKWADALGPVDDPQVFDWRDATERLEKTGPKTVMRQIEDQIDPGQRLILIQPVVRSARWGAPWTSLVRKRAAQWQQALDHDPRFEKIAQYPEVGYRRPPKGVRAVVYERS